MSSFASDKKNPEITIISTDHQPKTSSDNGIKRNLIMIIVLVLLLLLLAVSIFIIIPYLRRKPNVRPLKPMSALGAVTLKADSQSGGAGTSLPIAQEEQQEFVRGAVAPSQENLMTVESSTIAPTHQLPMERKSDVTSSTLIPKLASQQPHQNIPNHPNDIPQIPQKQPQPFESKGLVQGSQSQQTSSGTASSSSSSASTTNLSSESIKSNSSLETTNLHLSYLRPKDPVGYLFWEKPTGAPNIPGWTPVGTSGSAWGSFSKGGHHVSIWDHFVILDMITVVHEFDSKSDAGRPKTVSISPDSTLISTLRSTFMINLFAFDSADKKWKELKWASHNDQNVILTRGLIKDTTDIPNLNMSPSGRLLYIEESFNVVGVVYLSIDMKRQSAKIVTTLKGDDNSIIMPSYTEECFSIYYKNSFKEKSKRNKVEFYKLQDSELKLVHTISVSGEFKSYCNPSFAINGNRVVWLTSVEYKELSLYYIPDITKITFFDLNRSVSGLVELSGSIYRLSITDFTNTHIFFNIGLANSVAGFWPLESSISSRPSLIPVKEKEGCKIIDNAHLIFNDNKDKKFLYRRTSDPVAPIDPTSDAIIKVVRMIKRPSFDPGNVESGFESIDKVPLGPLPKLLESSYQLKAQIKSRPHAFALSRKAEHLVKIIDNNKSTKHRLLFDDKKIEASSREYQYSKVTISKDAKVIVAMTNYDSNATQIRSCDIYIRKNDLSFDKDYDKSWTLRANIFTEACKDITDYERESLYKSIPLLSPTGDFLYFIDKTDNRIFSSIEIYEKTGKLKFSEPSFVSRISRNIISPSFINDHFFEYSEVILGLTEHAPYHSKVYNPWRLTKNCPYKQEEYSDLAVARDGSYGMFIIYGGGSLPKNSNIKLYHLKPDLYKKRDPDNLTTIDMNSATKITTVTSKLPSLSKASFEIMHIDDKYVYFNVIGGVHKPGNHVYRWDYTAKGDLVEPIAESSDTRTPYLGFHMIDSDMTIVWTKDYDKDQEEQGWAQHTSFIFTRR